MFSEGFSAPLIQPSDELVPLTETSDVLELLFQLCLPKRPPSLQLLNFETLKMLAEAVEKYQVYNALEVCKVLME